MIEDIVIGMFLGGFLVAGPQIAWAFIKIRGQLARALKKAGVTLEELDKKTKGS